MKNNLIAVLDSEDLGAVCPEPEQNSVKAELEILKDFHHSVCGSLSMDDVNDALADYHNAMDGVA